MASNEQIATLNSSANAINDQKNRIIIDYGNGPVQYVKAKDGFAMRLFNACFPEHDEIGVGELASWVNLGVRDFPMVKDEDGNLCSIKGRDMIDDDTAFIYYHLVKYFKEHHPVMYVDEEYITRDEMANLLMGIDREMENRKEFARQHRISWAVDQKRKWEEARKGEAAED